MPILNKDMTLCISLAGRPSNIGTRFHNYLYDELGLNYIYKAFTTTRLEDAVAGLRGLGIRGCSVSMPFKEQIIPLLDVITPSAEAIQSVNTVVNEDGVLTAYNTDYLAVEQLFRERAVPTGVKTVVRGSGGMAKAVVAALRGLDFGDVTVLARDAATGQALAEQYGYRFTQTEPEPGDGFELIANVTPIGMTGKDGTPSDELAYTTALVDAADYVFDVVAFPSETPLIAAARQRDKTVLTGAEIIALQAARQFELYTGVALTADQIARASAFSRE